VRILQEQNWGGEMPLLCIMDRALFRRVLILTVSVAGFVSLGCGKEKKAPAVSNAAYQQALQDAKKSGVTITAASLAQPMPPAPQNATPIYVQLMSALKARPMSKSDQAAELKGRPPYPTPTPRELAAARSLLIRRSDVVKFMHQGAARPKCVFNRNWANPHPAGILFPEYASIREGARFLTTESIVMACDGKGLAAVQNETLGFTLAQHAGSDDILIAYLVREAINVITFYALQKIIAVRHGDARVARAVRLAIDRNWQAPNPVAALQHDMAMGLTEIETMRTERQQGVPSKLFGIAIPRSATDAEKQHWDETMNANGMYLLTQNEKTIKAMELPYSQARLEVKAIEAANESDQPASRKTASMWEMEKDSGHLIAHQLMYDATGIVDNRARETAVAEVTRTVATLFEYKAMHGAFPEALANMRPSVPVDPFDLKPLRYRREGKGFVVYSVGPALDYDGSVRMEKAHRAEKQTETVFRYGG